MSTYAKKVSQQQNGYDCGIFACLYARCLATGYPMVVLDNIPALRQVMIVELYQRKLSPLPGPTVKAGENYAVAFVQNFYFGRVLEVHESSVTLKFLHRVGAETFHWPRRDDLLKSISHAFSLVVLQSLCLSVVHSRFLNYSMFKIYSRP